MEIAGILERHDKLTFEITRRLAASIREGMSLPITQSHIRLMLFIRSKGGSTASDIAAYLGITLSAITSLVNKLTALNLVTRVRSDLDRRTVTIDLTESGREMLKHIDKKRKEFFNMCFSCLTDEEIDTYFNILGKITAELASFKQSKVLDILDGSAS